MNIYLDISLDWAAFWIAFAWCFQTYGRYSE